MKKRIISIDPDLIEVEKEPATGHITLTPQEAIDLHMFSCIRINGKIMFKKRRFDSVLQVNGGLKPGEIIAESNSAVFVLSPNQKESLPAPKPIMVTENEFDKVSGKWHYFQQVLAR